MSYYFNPETGVREIDADLYAQWVANGNQKADYWTPIPDPPSPQARWDGQQWVEPPPYKPQSCTMRQARLALLQVGKLADVDAAIAAMPEPQKSRAQIEWEYAATVDRISPLMSSLGPVLHMSDAELDALFKLAVTL